MALFANPPYIYLLASAKGYVIILSPNCFGLQLHRPTTNFDGDFGFVDNSSISIFSSSLCSLTPLFAPNLIACKFNKCCICANCGLAEKRLNGREAEGADLAIDDDDEEACCSCC